MIKEFEALLESSERLRIHLEDEALFKADRDKFIEIVQGLLKERQEAIDAFEWAKIKQASDIIVFTDDEKAIGQKIVAVDHEITRLLKLRMNDHQQEWHQIRKKGKSVSKYISPFQTPSRNGAFYDKRK